jgi:hypothetical protein
MLKSGYFSCWVVCYGASGSLGWEKLFPCARGIKFVGLGFYKSPSYYGQ